jgi:SAM-dependent methyltransferase/spore maturation protein CgeB
MNADRINEHYYGDPLHPTTQRCRQRIHWICKQVEGNRVLDVGCSQGIVCLLLGREGFECTGVDIESAAIDFARAALEKEEVPVRQRVKFELADAAQLPFADNSFDTVILAEILEHLTHPGRVLKEVRRVLKAGGKLIVSVPYGLLAHPDHKRAFYPFSLLETLGPFFRTTLIDALHPNQLVYAGVKDPSYNPPQPPDHPLITAYSRWARHLEERCLGFETALLETSTRLGQQIDALTSKAQTREDRITELEKALAENEKQTGTLRSTAEAAEEKLRSELATLKWTLASAQQQRDILQTELVTIQTELAGLQTEWAKAKSALAASEQERAALQNDLAARQEALACLSSDLAEAEARNSLAEQQLAELQKDAAAKTASLTSLNAELARSTDKLASAEQELAGLREALAAKECAINSLNAELARTTDKLASAEQQYQAMQKAASTRDAEFVHLLADLSGVRAASTAAERQAAALEVEVTRLRQELTAKDAGWQKRLTQSEALHAARLRERESQLLALLSQREGELKRQLANQRIREVARSVLPTDARVLVISKGDDDLLRLDGRIGWHFPQTLGGVYAGYHPADSAEAIGHLETLKSKGAQYLLIPAVAFWWLEFYAGFRCHLESNYRLLAYHSDSCLIFALTPPAAGQTARLALSILASDKQPTGPLPQSEQNRPVKTTKELPQAPTPPVLDGKPAGPMVQEPKPAATASTVAAPAPAPAQTGRAPLTIGGIFDEFTAACFQPDCHLITFRPDNWKSVLAQHPIDVLFIESAWHGNGGSWQYKLASFKKPMGEEIVDLLKHCNEREIPTVFWNKEDPPHFHRFIHRAPLFDVVFTSDADMIPKYRDVLKHDRIFALPFAAQPKIHHPIVHTARSYNVCFAGAYYAVDHDERRADMDHLLRPALEFGLHIYDRQHGIAGADARLYQFPDIYQPAIKGRLEYDAMVKAYKWYKVFLNVNSVKTSPTMFSRRVFELLASGTPVVSAPAKAIPLLLGDGLVPVAKSEEETKAHLERLLGDEEYWARLSLRGIRAVLSRHTYAHRLAEVCRRVGVQYAGPELPQIAAVAHVESAAMAQRLADTLARQTYRNFSLTLVPGKAVVKGKLDSLQKALPDIKVRILSPGSSLIQQLVEATSGSHVWLVNLDDYYGDEFLHDAALATTYSNADVIGKHTHFELRSDNLALELRHPGHDFRFETSFSPGSILAKAGKLDAGQWEAVAASQSFTLPDLRGLSIDRFNYVRRGAAIQPPSGQATSHPLAVVLA